MVQFKYTLLTVDNCILQIDLHYSESVMCFKVNYRNHCALRLHRAKLAFVSRRKVTSWKGLLLLNSEVALHLTGGRMKQTC